MESPAGRLLRLLSLLQTKPTWTATELAERLAVTTRTVRRDMTRLRDLGYPVPAEPGRFGGYQLGAGRGAATAAAHRRRGRRRRHRAARRGLRRGQPASRTSPSRRWPSSSRCCRCRLRERLQRCHATDGPPRRGSGPSVDPDALVLVAQGCRRLERLRFGYLDGAASAPSAAWSRSASSRPPALVPGGARRRPRRLADVPGRPHPGARAHRHRFVRTEEPDAAAMVAEGIAIDAYSVRAEVVLRGWGSMSPPARSRRRPDGSTGSTMAPPAAVGRQRLRVDRPISRLASIRLRGPRPARAQNRAAGARAAAAPAGEGGPMTTARRIGVEERRARLARGTSLPRPPGSTTPSMSPVPWSPSMPRTRRPCSSSSGRA